MCEADEPRILRLRVRRAATAAARKATRTLRSGWQFGSRFRM